jgi:hypothetical protein
MKPTNYANLDALLTGLVERGDVSKIARAEVLGWYQGVMADGNLVDSEIRNFSHAAQVWRWADFYRGAFVRDKVYPSDVDGFLELNRSYLYIEAKHWVNDGRPFPDVRTGQYYSLKRIAQKPDSTALYLIGDANDCSPWYMENLKSGGVCDLRGIADPVRRRGYLREFFEKWAIKALDMK